MQVVVSILNLGIPLECLPVARILGVEHGIAPGLVVHGLPALEEAAERAGEQRASDPTGKVLEDLRRLPVADQSTPLPRSVCGPTATCWP